MYVMAADVRGVLARDPSSPTGTPAEMADAAILAAITSAQSEVDGRLAVRYATPFPDATAPQVVKDIVRDIAAYLADLTYREGRDYDSAQDPVLLRYQRAQQLLVEIVTGKLDLAVDPLQQNGAATMRPHNRYTGNLFSLSDFDLGVTGYRRHHGPYY